MVTFPSRQLPPLRHSQPSESSVRDGEGASLVLWGQGSQVAVLEPAGGAQDPQLQAPRHGSPSEIRTTAQSESPERALPGLLPPGNGQLLL